MASILVLGGNNSGGFGMLDAASFTRKPDQFLVKPVGSLLVFLCFMFEIDGGVTEAHVDT